MPLAARCRRMADLVERMAADELWQLFRCVVPPTEVIRLQGGGRRRADDRAVSAAVVFVATSGRTWRQLASVLGPCWQTVYHHFAVEPGAGMATAPSCRPR